MYHHVSNKPGLVTLSPRTFREQMKWLAESGWKTVTAAEVEAFYRGETLPRKSVMLTFDDGWLDNWLQVFPVLQEFRLHAHLFLVTGLVGDGPVRISADAKEYSHEKCQLMIELGQADEALPEHIDVWLKKRSTAPVIVQVGMIRPEKGHDFMLEVLHCLKQRGVRFYWLIVGGGRREEEARLKAKIDYLGMNDCVLMCGLLSPVAPVYRRASLMVMPSRNEAFGMAIVEATVCGVPVMASRVGGIPSVIHHGYNGTLLPPADRAAWENALTSFLDAPECAQTMVLRGQEEMDARYSIDSTVRELIAQGRRYRYIRWGVTPDDNFHEGKCG
ncbi:glycosyltransferase [Escherichia coli]|nr:glycosyltransferase [Escherichia coli]